MSIYLLGNAVKAKLKEISHPLAEYFYWHNRDNTLVIIEGLYWNNETFYVINDKQWF